MLLARVGLPSTDLLRDAVYRRLWLSILASSFGAQVTLLAFPLTAATLLHADATQMGILTAMETLPLVLLSLPAGAWLDRLPKLSVYSWGETAFALTLATVPLAWWLDRLTLTWLCGVAFVIGAVDTLAGNAAQVVLTEIVPRERLVEAHAKTALAGAVAEVSGPGLAGVLIKLLGAPLALSADATLLLVSALNLRKLRVQAPPIGARQPIWPAMRAGLTFVRSHRVLLPMLACVGGWQMCNGAATAVQFLFATRRLGLDASDIGLSYVVLGIGTVAGSTMGHWLTQRFGSGGSLALGLGTCGIGWLVLALIPASTRGAIPYMVMLGCLGVGSVLILINFLALRQAVTPDRMLSRMTATMRWLTHLPAAPGALLGGWLGEHFGLQSTLGLAGGVALLLAVAGWRALAAAKPIMEESCP